MTTEQVLPSDDAARVRALDVSHSYIIQAPAGSGKTELLTQRFLALLARVENPEEVWAITFTRKAAAEMRRRVFTAIDDAMGPKPELEHKLRTWRLAEAVVRRDQEFGWDLTVNPSRLQIFTIDSLCSNLVRQMPVLSGFGTVPNITNFAERLYGLASRRTLQSLYEGGEVAAHVNVLLRHLDNNAELAEKLLSNMLANRDRWLPHVAGQDRPELTRQALENSLSEAVSEHLRSTHDALPFELMDEITDLANFAATQVELTSPIRSCANIDALPEPNGESLETWLGLRALLLTDKNEVRKLANLKIGFPPEKNGATADEKIQFAQMKKRAKSLYVKIAEYPSFVADLGQVQSLPPVRYSQEQWQIFVALQYLLRLAVAHLKVLFQETSEVDYTEVSHRALTALGSAESPTELALQLDYRLKHLLVDEFQDTARSQFDLIEGLIAGWQPDDGRTLFLVGDPMQSIYRFREANVGLFLQARDHGIADVRPQFLQLNNNFRSAPELVNWCNQVFSGAFPSDDSIESAAVKFSSAHAASSLEAEGAGVQLHSVMMPSQHVEGEVVSNLITEYSKQEPPLSIAVLVRSRNHLDEILPALRDARIRYRALDLEGLKDQPVVRDLFALTRALLHLGDRTAWLTVLRAPWCGLSLSDLFALAGQSADLTIWELIINEGRRQPLSTDGQLRLSRIKRVLARSLAERGRRSLSRWVEGTWAALAGPACIFNRAEERNAVAFFDLLDQADADGFYDDIDYLSDLIEKLKAADDTEADPNVQVMTIHRAKGLEFDVVIIPGIDRFPAVNDATLLRWIETTRQDGSPRLLLAPISATGERDPIHQYLAKLDAKMSRHEDLRLLYVAATRAKRNLHLIGGLKPKANDAFLPPRKGSFLSFIWNSVASTMTASENFHKEDTVATLARPSIDPQQRPIYRVPSEWMLPSSPSPKPWRANSQVDADVEDMVEFSWASDTARHVGTVVHRVLQQIATDGISQWQSQWLDTLEEYLYQLLQIKGVFPAELKDASQRCHKAIMLTLEDERGRWILSRHEKARNELELSAWLDGAAQRVALDRTFVDNGIRWIIDYKTGSHEGGTVDTFIDNELERYQAQLERYARIMHRMNPGNPIKLALYFPMLQGWREWDYRPS